MTVWIARAGLGHRTGVSGRVERRVERQQRGEALGGVPRRDDGHRPLGHRGDLARGQDDVRVVGQQQDLAGIDLLDRLQQLTGARVRGLAALDDTGDAEVAEDRREPVAGHDRDDPEWEDAGPVGRPCAGAIPVWVGRAVRGVALGGRGPVIGVRGEHRGPCLADVPGLVVEVLDADLAQRSLAESERDDLVRPLVVDVDLERAGVAGHQHRLADRLEVDPDGIDIERSRRGRLEQVHRLVAEALVGVGDERRRCRTDASGRPGCNGRRLSDRVPERALEEPVDALPARIHDAGLAQDREEGRRPRHGLLGCLDRRGQHGGEIVVDLGGPDSGLGRLADDGQDGALDGLCDRGVGRPRALRQGVCQVQAVETSLAVERLGHAPEDLARDHARIAARAHERPVADRGRDPIGRLPGGRLRLVERGADRGEHVRTGVAVRDRVDVEAVDLLDVGLEVGDGRPECLQEPGPIAGPAPHQATSVPLSARSRGRIAVGSAWTTAGGAPAGWTRKPVDVDDQPPDLQVERAADRVPDRPNRPVARPRRPARRGRRRGPAPGRARRQDGRGARAETGQGDRAVGRRDRRRSR